MMDSFRSRVKSWNSLWWVVLAAFVVGSYSKRAPHRSEQSVVTVNGKAITYADVQYSFGTMKRYADYFAKIYGMVIPAKELQERALKKCITEKLMDGVVAASGLEVDKAYFYEQLLQTLPNEFIENDGKVNLQAYKQYLDAMHLKIDAYEERVEQELKRSEVADFIKQTGYVSKNYIKDVLDTQLEKSFVVVKFPLSKYVQEVAQKETDEKILESYYQKNKENYRVEEKSKALYLTIDTDKYGKSVEVDDEAIERFYIKNKESMFKTPLMLKVRRILFEVSRDASAQVVAEVEKKAREVLALAQKSGSDFSSLAKKHSDDADSAENGGLLESFKRGTHDPKFESAAFRLKEKGNVSDLVRTQDGFEIIKLEERVASSEKPLSSVRNEIVQAIKARKGKTQFQSDLDGLTREIRENKDALKEFAEKNNLKLVASGWLGVKEAEKKSFEQVLATRVASKAKQGGLFGSFVHEGKAVVYQRTEFAKSHIPAFSAIESAVRDNYEQEEGLKLAAAAAKKAQLLVLSGKASLEAIAKELGLKHFVTLMSKKESAKLEGKPAQSFFEKAYSLSDSSLILEQQFGDDYYLVQLENVEDKSEESFDKAALKIFNLENKRFNDMNYQGFIASLMRTAKIENNDNSKVGSDVEVSDE